MTPSIILLYICSTVFIALFCVFSAFLLKIAIAAKARGASTRTSDCISKQMHPADEPDFAKVIQGQLSMAKVK